MPESLSRRERRGSDPPPGPMPSRVKEATYRSPPADGGRPLELMASFTAASMLVAGALWGLAASPEGWWMLIAAMLLHPGHDLPRDDRGHPGSTATAVGGVNARPVIHSPSVQSFGGWTLTGVEPVSTTYWRNLARPRPFALLSELKGPAGTAELAAEFVNSHPNGVRLHLEQMQAALLCSSARAPASLAGARGTHGQSPPRLLPAGQRPNAYLDLGCGLACAIPAFAEATARRRGHRTRNSG